MHQIATALTLLVLSAGTAAAEDGPDPRSFYDVRDYRIDLWVDPEMGSVRGVVGVSGVTVRDGVSEIVLDAERRLLIDGTSWVDGDDLFAEPLREVTSLSFRRTADQVRIELPGPLDRGEEFRVLVYYSGRPLRLDDFNGFHFSRTEDGAPWIGTSCQTIGAHTWWPCKSSFFHPEDKNERLQFRVTVPEGLTAVCNGRLESVTEHGGYRTFQWRHDYPQPTYSVAMNIAPYELIEETATLPGLEMPLQLHYYVLPKDVDKAALEFQVVPDLLRFFSEKFGPFPFPDSKFALVQSPIWGMEHSTVIAYGNSFPTYRRRHGLPDPFAIRNRRFDYILVHESAHEWFGNAVTVSDWGDFWLHEGFATYAEALWVEHRLGRGEMLAFVRESKPSIPKQATLFRPHRRDAGTAYAEVLYEKGAYVLHMLRYVMGDDGFFAAMKEYCTSPEFRYGHATTGQFQRLCEKHYGESLRFFFQPWVYGTGWPHYIVRDAKREGSKAEIQVDARADALFPFRMPLDVEVRTAQGATVQRHWLDEGSNKFTVTADSEIVSVEYPGLDWILCDVTRSP